MLFLYGLVILVFLYFALRAILNCWEIVRRREPNCYCELGLMLVVTGWCLLLLAAVLTPLVLSMSAAPYLGALLSLLVVVSAMVTLVGGCLGILGRVRYEHVRYDDTRSQAWCALLFAGLFLFVASVPMCLALLILTSAPSRISAHIERTSQIKAYSGDGSIHLLTRAYIPGFAETYGYSVELPEFARNRDITVRYSLRNLPHWARTMHVELRTSGGVERAHSIYCALVDERLDKVLAECQSTIGHLARTHTEGGGPEARLLRNILDYDLGVLASTEHLAIEFCYKLNGQPSAGPATIVVIVDAPLA